MPPQKPHEKFVDGPRRGPETEDRSLNANLTKDTLESQIAHLVQTSIQMVRQGSFSTVLTDESRLTRLTELAESRRDWVGVTSRAIVAETYDQVGMYAKAGALATHEIGTLALTALREEIRKSDPVRDVVRAYLWLVLQCAVSQFRKVSGHNEAVRFLSEAINLIDQLTGAAESQHIRSLFYFWRGRIHTSRYSFSEAEEDFQVALTIADRTLQEKLHRVDELDQLGSRRDDEHLKEVAIGNYVFSTLLGFGLGQLRQSEGRFLDSSQFLKVAVPLSRGTGDFHRRGYLHMLMGTALRAQNSLDEADRELLEAKRLFGDPPHRNIPPHPLHLARVDHQLALSKYNRAAIDAVHHKTFITEAEALNDQAQARSDDVSCSGYRDPVLDYGIKVVRSLIKTAAGLHDEGYHHAQFAIASIEQLHLPRGIRGWAWLAKGMASVEKVCDKRQMGEIRDAELAFEEVIRGEDVRVCDRAAAHLHLSRLYSTIGAPFKAAVHYDRAAALVQDSEHGWIKDLALKTQKALGTSLSAECTFNVKDLLEAATEQNVSAWSFITTLLDAEVKKRLLILKQHTLEEGTEKFAQEVGLSRAMIFNWKKDPELKDLFPAQKARRVRKNRPGPDRL